jgi:chromosome segregation ATPase
VNILYRIIQLEDELKNKQRILKSV